MPNGFTIPIPFLGEFKIYYYAIIIMAGAVAAAYLAAIEARRRGISAEYVWDALIWVLLGGIIGARIWHIFTPPPSMVELGITTQYYLTHPLDAINIRNGGLGIPGAVIGGTIALYFYCRRKGLDFLTWTDIAAPALALGQAIGRWGNYFNQEVYGQPTTFPWGIKITNSTGYPPETRFHPLFLYELIYNFANVIFLLWFARRFKDRLLPGDVFLMYLITYPIGRFLLDFLRLDAALVGGININQTIMLATALCSSLIIFFRHRKKSTQAASITSAAVDEEES